MECYSAIKKNEIMPFAAKWMNLESVTPSEVSQTQKEKYHMRSHFLWILKRSDTNKLTYKQQQTHREQTYGCQREGIGLGRLCTHWITMDNQQKPIV